VVFPATHPSVVAPLGWTLSQASLQALTARANEQLVKKCPPLGATTTITKEQAVVDILCFRGYGTLGNASEFMEKLLG